MELQAVVTPSVSSILPERKNDSMVENTWESIQEALRPIVQDEAGAIEVVSAFYDVAWVFIESSASTYSEAWEVGFSVSWRGAGGLVAELRGRGENYLDFAFDAESGVVSERVERVMRSIGMRPVR